MGGDAHRRAVHHSAVVHYDNHKEEIPYFAEKSFLEDYDEDNLRIAFENSATVSIAYTLSLIHIFCRNISATA